MRSAIAALFCALLPSCVPPSVRASSVPAPSTSAQVGASPVFIEDDFPRALREARAKNRPLFIDAWAPWCHTCLSMRSYVFNDSSLRPLANDFVWLAIDTEKASNADFLAAYPLQVWPTLWVINAADGKPALKWLGSATPAELVSLLGDASAAIVQGDTGGEAGAALLRGNQAAARGEVDDAIREYGATLEIAPQDWSKRAHAVEALAQLLEGKKDYPACVALAKREISRLPAGTSLVNVALNGLSCASKSPLDSGERAELPALALFVEKLATDRSLPVLADDRSGLFEALVDYYKELGRAMDTRVVALKWSEFLDGEAAHARTPAARSVFDAHRMLAYLEIGAPARALPMLAESEREFPKDYNPPARIAKIYLEMKRYDEALAAVDRALANGYGPRKLRLYSLKADVQRAKGDGTGIASTLREAIAFGKGLPREPHSDKLVAELESRLLEASR